MEFYEARGEELGGGSDELHAYLDRSVAALREDLLSVSGIGRETADSIVLYAAGKPTFVVDAYTYRILLRHRLISPEDDYEAIKETMESNLPRETELWNDYHAQLVAVGKDHCRPRARCEGCPLEPFPHDRLAGTADGE
jgi:endonuclease-3 related protein